MNLKFDEKKLQQPIEKTRSYFWQTLEPEQGILEMVSVDSMTIQDRPDEEKISSRKLKFDLQMIGMSRA